MISPSRVSSLLVIDMLNDFVDKKGALYVPKGIEIVEPILEKIKVFREKNLPIIYICDAHDEDDDEFKLWPKHAVAGTWGSEIFPPLKPGDWGKVVEKKRYSGFFGTNLHELLKDLGTKEIYLTGLLTDVCVFFTAHDGYNLGYSIKVLSDSTTSLDDETHKMFLEKMKTLFGAEII